MSKILFGFILLALFGTALSQFDLLEEDWMDDIDGASVLSNAAPKYTAEDYITGVAFTGDKCQTGFQKVTGDLNKGAGGDFIYMCVKKGGSEPPLTDMQFVTGDESMDIGACGKGYQIVDQDLNKGAGGKFIYLCVKYGTDSAPIARVQPFFGKNAFNKCKAEGFNKYSTVDLNAGAGGDFVYFCWETYGKAVKKVVVRDMAYDLRQLSQDDAAVKGVDEIVVRAGSGESETSSLSGEYTVTESQSWETSSGTEISVGMEFEVGVPGIASSTMSVSATQSFTYTMGKSREESEAKSYSLQCKAEPYTIKKCTAVYRRSTINVPYHATKITFYADGTSETTQFSGMFKGVSAGKLEILEQVTPLPKPSKKSKKSKKSVRK